MEEDSTVVLRNLTELVRKYAQLQAEHWALTTVLKAFVAADQPPHGWDSLLEDTRKSQPYRDILAQYAEWLALAEHVVDQSEVDRLLKTIPSARTPH